MTVTASLPKRNSVSSLHIRCRTTASLRATAMRARAKPRVLAICPQARRLDHLRERTSKEARLETPDSQAKAAKDLRQAAELIMVLSEQRPHELK